MNNKHTYYMYILASKKDGVLYTGMTNDLERRMHEHRSESIQGFTQRYHIKRLVYYETFETPYDAIRREKVIKKWYRKWKIESIEENNPKWMDLFVDGNVLPFS
ncbi:MAG: GIY-YIG nuclease family protein [Bacteroidota bacterium]